MQVTLFVLTVFHAHCLPYSAAWLWVQVWNQQYYMKVQMTEGKRQGTNEQPACMVQK
jgi:hypothetical protein